jgi:hypothetical protein
MHQAAPRWCGMKSSVSPMFLTYFMVKWEEVEQHVTDQKCTECGRPLARTEKFEYEKGQNFEGYVCHNDKRVIWVKAG